MLNPLPYELSHLESTQEKVEKSCFVSSEWSALRDQVVLPVGFICVFLFFYLRLQTFKLLKDKCFHFCFSASASILWAVLGYLYVKLLTIMSWVVCHTIWRFVFYYIMGHFCYCHPCYILISATSVGCAYLFITWICLTLESWGLVCTWIQANIYS